MTRMIPRQVFIGHDSREAIATEVCELSVRLNSDAPITVTRLVEPALRHIGLYRRQWYCTPEGQRIDTIDKKPFSTDFSFTRFLVPALMQHSGLALFCDSDFLFTGDIDELFGIAEDEAGKAVWVVQHGPRDERGIKMDGMQQQPYFRKNWSSLVLWDCGHPANHRLAPHQANTATGQWLHGFSWLEDSDIGSLPHDWNWLAGIDPPVCNAAPPRGIHFTLGIPDMRGHEAAPYADHWRAVKSRL